MTFWLTLLAVLLMWVMWICAFMHQMYPLVRPTVQKPVYKVRCAEDKICKNFPEELCSGANSTLFGYCYDVTNGCLPCKAP